MEAMLKKISIGPKDSLEEAVKVMGNFGVSALAVVDGEKLVGILSAKDLFKSFVSAKYHNGQTGFVDTLMTSSPESIEYNQSLHFVIDVFMKGSHHYYPVVDKGVFKGTIYREDLLKEVDKMPNATWHPH